MSVETVDTPSIENLVMSFSTFCTDLCTEFSPDEKGQKAPYFNWDFRLTLPIYPQGVENFSPIKKNVPKRVRNRWKNGEKAVKNVVISWKT